jgi:superfamily II DNA/RNA helicase
VPHHADDYVHRIGRTGRAGRTGVAITIVAPIDSKSVSAIERLIGQTIPWMGAPAAAEPRDRRPTHNGDGTGRAEPRNRDRGRDRKPAHRGKKEVPAHTAPPPPPPPQIEERETGHLPAFLLRPVSVKA